MSITLERAWQALSAMDNILILTHASPDGDAVGSAFALYLALRDMGKNVWVHTDRVPWTMADTVIKGAYADREPDYVVTVDVGDKKLLQKVDRETYGDRVDLNIDHHGTNVMFAKETYVDPDAAAASEALYDLFVSGGLTITKEIAERLYVGISTDTGCFKYANVTPKTLRVTAALLETGIDAAGMNTLLFDTKSPAYVNFERAAMNGLTLYFGGKAALMVITQQMYRDAGIDEADTQGINALPRTIEGVYAGLTLKEKDNGVFHASVRTKAPVIASDVCAVFGGGGHLYAAGCELGSDLQKAKDLLLGAVEKELRSLGLL